MSGFLKGGDQAAGSPTRGARQGRPADEGAGAGGAFWRELQSIGWCPIQAQPPLPDMPWLSSGEVVAPPARIRPPTDTWLASATTLILDGECR